MLESIVRSSAYATLVLVLISANAKGAPSAYEFATTADQGTGIRFRLPYTMGTHEGRAGQVKGSIKIDLNDPSAAKGMFRVPIDAITSDHTERDCHTREALGLDYEKSYYPEEHVCNEGNELPAGGKNAVEHPHIDLNISSVRSLDPTGRIRLDGDTDIEVVGTWSIHGVSRPTQFPLKVTPEAGRFRLRGEVPFSLEKFGIKVIPAKILFVTIGVEDKATVLFDIIMDPVQTPQRR